MKELLCNRAVALKALLMVMMLLSAPLLYAQQEVFEGNLEQREGNPPVFLYKGTPLKGRWKVNYISDDFVTRYYLADFKQGVRGDTVRYYDTKSDVLLKEEVHLSAREVLTRKYYGADCLLSEYRCVDDEFEGLHKEWYLNGKLSVTSEYVGGRLNGKRTYWDENGRLWEIKNYKDDMPDGWSKVWIYTDPITGKAVNQIARSFYEQSHLPRIVEVYSFEGEREALIRRSVFAKGQKERYESFKPSCDSTRIDTLDAGFEIRDYKDGKLFSVERYDSEWNAHGLFETYYDNGAVESRQMYDRWELVAENHYDYEPRTDVKLTTLTEEAYNVLRAQSCNSVHLAESKDVKPLIIRNRAGAEIFSVTDEDRRYEYYGYDPIWKLHLGFSSIGDYNDVYFYVVHDNGANLSIQVRCAAVNGNTGTVAVLSKVLEGEDLLVVYRYCAETEDSGFFLPVFSYTLQDTPYFENIFWNGDNSLLLKGEGAIRLDLEPGSLEIVEEEMY